MGFAVRRTLRGVCLVAAVACSLRACAAAADAPAGPRQVPVQAGVLEVDAGQTWATRVVAPGFSGDEALVLSLRARLQTAYLGGCNCVLQVLLNGTPLCDNPMRPRLVNKASWFDPPGTKYHFSWYSADQKGWLTIFAPAFEGDWGGTGRDYDFLFDLSGLVAPGQVVPVTIRYLNPDIPAALGVARAPLTLDRVVLDVMTRAELERLRGEALRRQRARDVPVTAELPAGATPGDRPYEIVWSGRKESPRAQVGFEDLRGWTMQAVGDGEVALTASVDHLL